MSEFGNTFQPDQKKRLTREAILETLASTPETINLEGTDLKDLDLGGLDLHRQNFSNCDARGLILEASNISETNWTDAVVEAHGPYTNFKQVKATGSTFGATRNLYLREQKLKKARAEELDSNSYMGFDGRNGNFQKCTWNNIDFQGESGYGAMFDYADLSGSTFDGCDFRGLDWTTTKIDNIKITIYDPESLNGLSITADQIPIIINAAQFNDEAYNEGFKEECKKQNPQDLLWNFLGINVVESKV